MKINTSNIMLLHVFIILVTSCSGERNSSLDSSLPAPIDFMFSNPIDEEVCEDLSSPLCHESLKNLTEREVDLFKLIIGPGYIGQTEDIYNRKIRSSMDLLRSMKAQYYKDNKGAEQGAIYEQAKFNTIYEDLLGGELRMVKEAELTVPLNIPNIAIPASEICIEKENYYTYGVCLEGYYQAVFEKLATNYRQRAQILASDFKDESAGYTFMNRSKLISRLLEIRKAQMGQFFETNEFRYELFKSKKLLDVNVDNVPWFLVHTTPKFWLKELKQAADQFGSLLSKTIESRQRYITAFEQGLELVEKNTNTEILGVEKEKSIESMKLIRNVEKEGVDQLRKQASDLKKELEAAKTRLGKEVKKLVPLSADPELLVKKGHIRVNRVDELAFCNFGRQPKSYANEKDFEACKLDMSFPDREFISGPTIKIKGGVSDITKVQIKTSSNFQMVANGVYHSLNEFRLKAEIFLAYADCFSRDYINAPFRNFAHWRKLCKSDRYVNSMIVNPHRNEWVNLDYRPAILLMPLDVYLTSSEYVSKLYRDPISRRLNKVKPKSGDVIYRFCMESDNGLCIDEDKTKRWASGDHSALSELIAEKRQIGAKLSELNYAFSHSWAHRVNATTNFDGYYLSESTGESEGWGSSVSNSVGASLSFYAGVSVGRSDSTSKSFSKSKSSSLQVGFFHQKTPSDRYVLGRLLGQCLDANVEPLSNPEERFVSIGMNASFSLPENCHYLNLFINDDPDGVGMTSCKQEEVNGIHVSDEKGHTFFNLSGDPWIDNYQGQCTRLDEPTEITVELYTSFEEALGKSLEIVGDDEKLYKLIGGDIASNPQAVTAARAKVNEYLDGNDVPGDSKLRSIIVRYVDNWVALNVMGKNEIKLNSQIKQGDDRLRSQSINIEKLQIQYDLVKNLKDIGDFKGKVNEIKMQFWKQVAAVSDESLSFYVANIKELLSLYRKSLLYNDANLDAATSSRLDDLAAIISSFETLDFTSSLDDDLKSRITENIDDSDVKDSIEKQIAAISEDLSGDLTLQSFSLKLGQLIFDNEQDDRFFKSLNLEKISYCNVPVLSKKEMLGKKGSLELLEKDFIAFSSSDQYGIARFNPDFDIDKACGALVSGNDLVEECSNRLTKARSLILKDPSCENGQCWRDFADLEGYFDITPQLSLSNHSCLAGVIETSPVEFVNVAIEYVGRASGSDASIPAFASVDVSPLSVWNGDEIKSVSLVNYHAYGSKFTFGLSAEKVDEIRKTPLIMQPSSYFNVCYSGEMQDGLNNNECFNRVADLNFSKEFEDRRLGPLTGFRGDTRFSIIIPKPSEVGVGYAYDQLRVFHDNLINLRLHLLVQ